MNLFSIRGDISLEYINFFSKYLLKASSSTLTKIFRLIKNFFAIGYSNTSQFMGNRFQLAISPESSLFFLDFPIEHLYINSSKYLSIDENFSPIGYLNRRFQLAVCPVSGQVFQNFPIEHLSINSSIGNVDR